VADVADPTFSSNVDQLEADRSRLAEGAVSRQGALDLERKESSAREEATLKPMEDRASKAIDDLQGMKPPTPTDLPTWKPKPPIDAKDYQQFSYALIGMALIGGAVSRGNWLGVSSSLNGALKGYMQGNLARSDQDFKDYQTKFTEAKAHEDQVQKQFHDILENRRLSINDMLTQVRITAARYDRQDVRMAAEQKSIDSIWKQVDDKDKAISTLTEQHDKTSKMYELGQLRAKIMSGGAGAELTPAGQAWLDQSAALGDPTYIRASMGRFTGPNARHLINHFAETGVAPGDLAAAASARKAYESTLMQAEKRTAGVERLTGSITELENKITGLVKDVNGTGAMSLNEVMNAVKNQLGDEKLSELRTLMGAVGRQYIEAVTMPGSNAQLHATAQDWADALFSPAINNANWKGVMQGMNAEIGATTKALHGTTAGLKQSIRTGTDTGAGPAPATTLKPEDQALLDKYAPRAVPAPR
jgi:hypothetical protein